MILKGRHARYIWRRLAVALLIATVSVMANAYTVVMRDGRRVEIPNEFLVSTVTLTYELSPGIQKTLQLASIDIAATERANNQPVGSLLKRATTPRSVSTAIQAKPSRRSITNQDLESFRRTRLENEASYERRRKELGLPSLEETRRAAELEAERGRQRLLTMRSQETESESYWRSRASELRTEIAATNARIDFVRARLNETPAGPAFGVFTTALPFGLVGHSRFGRGVPRTVHQPLVFSARQGGPQIGGHLRVGGGHTRTQGFINPSRGLRAPGRISVLPSVSLLSIPFQNDDYSYERTALMIQLDELLAHRAGLLARWRDLEEEARRAGAYPGWLRP